MFSCCQWILYSIQKPKLCSVIALTGGVCCCLTVLEKSLVPLSWWLGGLGWRDRLLASRTMRTMRGRASGLSVPPSAVEASFCSRCFSPRSLSFLFLNRSKKKPLVCKFTLCLGHRWFCSYMEYFWLLKTGYVSVRKNCPNSIYIYIYIHTHTYKMLIHNFSSCLWIARAVKII